MNCKQLNHQLHKIIYSMTVRNGEGMLLRGGPWNIKPKTSADTNNRVLFSYNILNVALLLGGAGFVKTILLWGGRC